MRQTTLTLLGLAVVAALPGCTDEMVSPRGGAAFSARAPRFSISVSIAADTLAVGDSTRAVAIVRDKQGLITARTVTWHSSDTSIASVSTAGMVGAHRAGRAFIQASTAGASDQVALTVVDVAIPVDTVPVPTDTVPQATAPAFADDLETGDFSRIANNFAWKTPDGTDAIPGVGANGSFTRSSGTWSGSQAGLVIYLQSTPGNVQGGDAGVRGPFTVTSSNANTLFFAGDATGAVQTRTHRAFITNTFAHTGTRSVKLIFGPDLPENDSRSQIGFNLPMPGVSELWLEYYLFIPANYVHRAQLGGLTNNKFAGIFGRDRTPDPSRMLFDFEAIDDGSGGSDLFAQSVFSTGDILSGAVHVRGDSGFTGVGMIRAPGSPAVLGDWNRIRLHFRSESAALAADGVQEMWINSTKVFRASGRSFGYPSAAGSAWFGTYPALVDNGYLMGAANSGFTALTIFYIDDVKFYLINPGW